MAGLCRTRGGLITAMQAWDYKVFASVIAEISEKLSGAPMLRRASEKSSTMLNVTNASYFQREVPEAKQVPLAANVLAMREGRWPQFWSPSRGTEHLAANRPESRNEVFIWR
eukprot:s2670_g2.t1